jgi:hypothetical protein
VKMDFSAEKISGFLDHPNAEHFIGHCARGKQRKKYVLKDMNTGNYLSKSLSLVISEINS